MSKKKKQKRIKPDRYSRKGPFEIAQFDKTVVMRNNMTESEHREFIERMSKEYPAFCESIDSIVKEIREDVVKFDTLKLLQCGYTHMFMSALNKKSESEYDFDNMILVRMIDYIQSVIASTEPNDGRDFDDKRWQRLVLKVEKLYTHLNQYHLYHTAYLQGNDSDYNVEYDRLYVLAQLLQISVRGNRYFVHEIEHLQDLLEPHNDIFIELFNLSVKDFVGGLESIQVSLTQGLGKIVDGFGDFQEATLKALDTKYKKLGQFESDPKKAMDVVIKENGWEEWRDSLFFDVKKLTDFPDVLLEELSWEPGQDQEFFKEGEFAGWPFRVLPTQIRPFLKINGEFYCFDYYCLFDNIYRVIQRIIFGLKPVYKESWNKLQKERSESLPFELLKKILPESKVYNSIYYRARVGNSKKT